MKKLIIILSAVCLLVISNVILAAALKVGVIDLQKILQNIPQVSTADAAFKKQFIARELKLKASQAQLQKDTAALKNNGSTMSKQEKESAQDKINTEQNNVQLSQTQYAQDMQSAQARTMRRILAKIKQKVNQVARSGGYDLILPKSATVYFKSQYDITQKVITALKK
jgi:outer membrane protein